ncbi:uncharacterized protein V6R79_025005 [Siganus canaliculatus]
MNFKQLWSLLLPPPTSCWENRPPQWNQERKKERRLPKLNTCRRPGRPVAGRSLHPGYMEYSETPPQLHPGPTGGALRTAQGASPHSYIGHLKHVLNQKSQRVLGHQMVKDFTKPAEYTGELIGVEYLYQTSLVLEDVILDPDTAAVDAIEETDEGIEEDVEDPTVFEPDTPSTSAEARSGAPADAPASGPSRPAAPASPEAPEAQTPASQHSSSDSEEEVQGPGGQPGYQHVLRLAKALLEARSLQGLNDRRVDRLIALWKRLPESEKQRVVYPPRHLVAKSRWSLILSDYVAVREAVLFSPRLMAQTQIQLFELNQKTLCQWYNSRQKERTTAVLLQGSGIVPAAAIASQQKGCPLYRWDEDSPFNITFRRSSLDPPPGDSHHSCRLPSPRHCPHRCPHRCRRCHLCSRAHHQAHYILCCQHLLLLLLLLHHSSSGPPSPLPLLVCLLFLHQFRSQRPQNTGRGRRLQLLLRGRGQHLQRDPACMRAVSVASPKG